MTYFGDIIEQIDALRDLLGDVAGGTDLPAAVDALSDDDAITLMAHGAALANSANQLCAVGGAVIARRSERHAGTDGVAQSRGHRNAVAFVQELTGATRSDAAKHLRVGESLLQVLPPSTVDAAPTSEDDDETSGSTPSPPPPWDDCLSRALFSGTLTATQHDAIRRGLGTPPDGADEQSSIAAREAWALAAADLIDEAASRTVEELIRTARTIRDRLDPEGAHARFEARHLGRSFRTYTDADGIHHGHLTFEDEGFAWVRAIVDAALRPRRGGPRFVDATERAAAEDLTADPRTNDQLAYDLVLDVLRAGALADAKDVFGTRQAGVRVVHVVREHDEHHSSDRSVGAQASLEDDGSSLPDWLVATRSCDAGRVSVTVDRSGRPLDVGREHRLFTPRQRIALAVRDSGCLWRGCDRPASYCEAHHIDEWAADHGRTDIDRGILLCRYHHMTLHNGGWRITRKGTRDFELHPPGGEPAIPLPARLIRRYLWGIDPLPKRFHPAA